MSRVVGLPEQQAHKKPHVSCTFRLLFKYEIVPKTRASNNEPAILCIMRTPQCKSHVVYETLYALQLLETQPCKHKYHRGILPISTWYLTLRPLHKPCVLLRLG